jgi:hypothetical protein
MSCEGGNRLRDKDMRNIKDLEGGKPIGKIRP